VVVVRNRVLVERAVEEHTGFIEDQNYPTTSLHLHLTAPLPCSTSLPAAIINRIDLIRRIAAIRHPKAPSVNAVAVHGPISIRNPSNLLILTGAGAVDGIAVVEPTIAEPIVGEGVLVAI